MTGDCHEDACGGVDDGYIRIRNDDDDSNDDQDADRGGHDHVDAPDTGMIVINDVDASSLLL